jgi:putative transposase
MPPIRPELLDELLKDYQKPEDLLGQDGLLQQLTKALVERALDGEITHHLGYEKHDSAGDNSGNSRNGTSPKTLRGKRGQVRIDVPRDRASEFEPQLVKKNQTRERLARPLRPEHAVPRQGQPFARADGRA